MASVAAAWQHQLPFSAASREALMKISHLLDESATFFIFQFILQVVHLQFDRSPNSAKKKSS